MLWPFLKGQKCRKTDFRSLPVEVLKRWLCLVPCLEISELTVYHTAVMLSKSKLDIFKSHDVSFLHLQVAESSLFTLLYTLLLFKKSLPFLRVALMLRAARWSAATDFRSLPVEVLKRRLGLGMSEVKKTCSRKNHLIFPGSQNWVNLPHLD